MATMALTLAMSLFLIPAGAEVARDFIAPRLDCSCSTSPPKEEDVCKVENPDNCRQFYYCVNGMQTSDPFTCSDGEMFDATVGDCVVGNCTDSGGGSCQYECPTTKASGKVADRYDCKFYSQCTLGVKATELIPCPAETPFFDGTTCQEKESKCCSCKPYCSSRDEDRTVIDMTDCKTYYFCTEENEIPQYSGHCPSGNFDILSGKCSQTAPCVTLCTNVVQADGCIDVFTCEESGYFAKCREKCDPRYYHCTEGNVGDAIAPNECQSGHFFHPDSLICQTCSKCPFAESSCSLV